MRKLWNETGYSPINKDLDIGTAEDIINTLTPLFAKKDESGRYVPTDEEFSMDEFDDTIIDAAVGAFDAATYMATGIIGMYQPERRKPDDFPEEVQERIAVAVGYLKTVRDAYEFLVGRKTQEPEDTTGVILNKVVGEFIDAQEEGREVDSTVKLTLLAAVALMSSELAFLRKQA